MFMSALGKGHFAGNDEVPKQSKQRKCTVLRTPCKGQKRLVVCVFRSTMSLSLIKRTEAVTVAIESSLI